MIAIDNDQIRERLHKVIPGGAHTYSRGDDQFPANAPAALQSGKGCEVIGTDAKLYLDYGMALRSVALGYTNERVNAAAIRQIELGTNLSRASLTEIEAAEDFCGTLPSCDMVKFAKHGSTVVSAAVKLARAFTGRQIIARCAQHPFFSFDDWFIGDTVMSRGVPSAISELTKRFDFNDIGTLQSLFDQYPNQIACVLLEPSTAIEPKPGYLKAVAELCKKYGAISIFDEMITGFRWSLEGASAYYGAEPDLKTFGKAMANGFAVAALTGRREIMQIGGINHPGERVFLTSTTHGAEMCGLGAFRETLQIYKEQNITEHLWKIGQRLIDGCKQEILQANLEGYAFFEGAGCSPLYYFKGKNGEISQELRTLFMQELVKEGILMPWISISWAHTNDHVDRTIFAARNALKTVSKALNGQISDYLVGPAVKPVFRKMN